MTKLIVDIETNAIHDWENLTDLKEVHCIALLDESSENEEVHSYNSQTPGALERAADLVGAADVIIGHNLIGFDWPALVKIYPYVTLNPPQLVDTKVLAACIHPDLKTEDYRRDDFPKQYAGRNSLKAWGIRMGVLKDDHGDTEDWSTWSAEMEEYCRQDVRVTLALYKHLLASNPAPCMMHLEHSFATAIQKQVANGFPFDGEKANKLAALLMKKRGELEVELQKLFKPKVVETKTPVWLTPDGKTWKTKKSAVAADWKPNNVERGPNRTKEIPFNPGSRDQIAERLMADGWKPKAYEGKRPEINEGVLKSIGTPEAALLLDYLLVQKRMGALAEGANAWMSMERNGRIHGNVNTNGTYSGRCSHSRPNLAQVPASRAPYGAECRELFKAPEGKVLVGADASGIELRVLAHYLAPWDKGAYGNAIVQGDIHVENQKAAGLSTRADAKKFIYMLIYGAGNRALGEIVGGGEKEGKELRRKFMVKIPAFAKLTQAVKDSVNLKGTLIGLDGRILPARKVFSALNLLCQSAAAVIMKQALVDFVARAKCSYEPLGDSTILAVRGAGYEYEMHANVHDEVQFSCAHADAGKLGKMFVSSIQKAGRILNVRCPLDGAYIIGHNWSDTH
jgi:DNA polymerase-1